MLRGVDRIELRGVRAFGRHGVFDDEKLRGQEFVVDVVLECDLDLPSRTDALGDTVDYGIVAQQVARAVETTRFDLIEALAGHIADLALHDPMVSAVEVRIAKPAAPVTVQLDEVAVVVRRTRPT